MADVIEDEGIKSSASNTDTGMEDSEHASKLKKARKGKLAQLTKRKNVMIHLMEDVSSVQEVKENLHKYTQLLEEFKSIHRAYQELLTQDEVKKDECEWFEPKIKEINTFNSSVSEWLSGATKAAEPQVVEVGPKDSVSQVSSHGSKSRASSVASARIRAEAERAAIMTKVAALKEKHDLEEQENALQKEIQVLKQKREALELRTQLAVSSSKIAVLMSAEEGSMVARTTAKQLSLHQPEPAADTQVKQSDENLPSEGKDAMNAYLAEMSMKSDAKESEFLSLENVAKAFSMMQTPSIRPKDGVHFESILEREGAGSKKASSVQTLSPFDSFRKDVPSKTSVPENKCKTSILITF